MNNLNDIFFAPAANQDLTYDQVLEDVQRYFAEISWDFCCWERHYVRLVFIFLP